jgi:lysozyme family protein
MATKYKFDELKGEYRSRWDRMKVKRRAAIDAVARKILAGKERYQAVEADTGVPWAIVGVWHNREAGCDFAGVLHNGEKILGTGRKTRLVPSGRGPFDDWHEAALDAIALKGWNKNTKWSIEFFLYGSETFNGFGYRMRGVPSAYLWAGSDQYTKGKFVKDGPRGWDPNVVDKQLGVAPLMRRLWELDPDAVFGNDSHSAPSAPVIINVDDGLDDVEIEEIQTLLRRKKYLVVVDGLWGKKTAGALAEFQDSAGLPRTVTQDRAWVDKETLAALALAPDAQVSVERATTTAKEMRKAGDQTVIQAFRARVSAILAAIVAALFGTAENASTAVSWLSPVKDFIGEVPVSLWVVAVILVAGAIYWMAHKVEVSAVGAVRSGRDVGPQ